MSATIGDIDAMMRDNFHLFGRMVFEHLKGPGVYKENWSLEVFSRELADVWNGRTKRLILNAPPRGLKSILASVALPAYILGHNPAEKIICISHDNDLANTLGRQCRAILQSDWYGRVFPNVVFSKLAEDAIETTAGGGRKATSIEGGITGHGGNYIIIDDPMTAAEAPSAASREKVKRLYTDVIFSRLDDKANGRIVLVMQRLHTDDLTGFLETRPNFRKVSLPAIATRDETHELWNGRVYVRKQGELLHPEHEPKAAIDEAKANVSAAKFEAQWQQSPIPDNGRYLRTEWIKRTSRMPNLEGMRITISWDTAIKSHENADYSVATVWASADDKHYLIDVVRIRVELPELIAAAISLNEKYKPDMTLVEDQGSGANLEAFLRTRYAIYPKLIRPVGDKEGRFEAACYFFEKGQVYLPTEAPWLMEYERELLGTGQGATHDDQVDSTSQYFIWSRDRGGGVLKVHNIIDEDEEDDNWIIDQIMRYRGWR